MPIADRHLRSLADAEPVPFWLDTPAPEAGPTLAGTVEADLVVVGGGYTGLWTALMAKERDPSRSVVLLEAHRIGSAASGRNGGFCSSSLTHGIANGLSRWPDEIAELERQGLANLDEIEATLGRYGIDADLERTGEINVATAPWHLGNECARMLDPLRRFGHDARVARTRTRCRPGALAHVPRWALEQDGHRAGRPRQAGVGPGRGAPAASGCRSTKTRRRCGWRRTVPAMRVRVEFGSARAGAVALATNAFQSLLRRVQALTSSRSTTTC